MLAQNWKEERQKRMVAERQVAILQPKAEFMDKVMDCDEKIDIGQAAKILELPFGRNSLFVKLRERGIFFKNRNEPKQEYIERGYFQLKEKWIERDHHDSFMVVKVLVTQRGLSFISSLFHASPKEKELALI
jgi:phage antirepressor YoqD-like protein